MASSDPYAAEVQPLKAGATAGYLSAYKAVAIDQTAGTTSPDHPITADEHGPVTREEWTASEGRCRKCLSPFNPEDTRFNGNARSGEGPYCRYCVDLCRQSQSFLHLCEICR